MTAVPTEQAHEGKGDRMGLSGIRKPDIGKASS